METRSTAFLSLAAALTTAVWVVLTIVSVATASPFETLADKVTSIQGQFALHVINYINAALITLTIMAAFTGFYFYTRDEAPLWSMIGLICLPMYGLANLVVYLSQVFVVPGLMVMYQDPATTATANVLLRLTLHTWTGSAAAFVNGLAYAVLGVPSIIQGMLLARKPAGGMLRTGGWLLAASGILSQVALIGQGIGSSLLAMMTMVSGVFCLAALVLIGLTLLRSESTPAVSAPSRAVTAMWK